MTLNEWITNRPVGDALTTWKTTISSTLSLSRNIKGIPFTLKMSVEEKEKVNHLVEQAVSSWNKEQSNSFSTHSVASLTDTDIQVLREIGVEIPLEGDNRQRKLYLSSDQLMAIVTNGDDHITFWGLSYDGDLTSIWKKVSALDDWFSIQLDYAFDEEFGYLTSSPAVAGTGLQIKLVTFLPGIKAVQQVDNLSGKLARSGYRITNLGGTNRQRWAPFILIENAYSIGVTEETLCNRLEEAQKNMEFVEEKAWNNFYGLHEEEIKDNIWRAIGVFSYARRIGHDEAIECISWLYVGMKEHILPVINNNLFYQLLYLISPFYVAKKVQKEGMDERDIDLWRAALSRELIKEMKL